LIQPSGRLAHGLAVAIAGGELALDESQAILLAEWDDPRSRTINPIAGEAPPVSAEQNV
jgi:hypothetical protein